MERMNGCVRCEVLALKGGDKQGWELRTPGRCVAANVDPS